MPAAGGDTVISSPGIPAGEMRRAYTAASASSPWTHATVAVPSAATTTAVPKALSVPPTSWMVAPGAPSEERRIASTRMSVSPVVHAATAPPSGVAAIRGCEDVADGLGVRIRWGPNEPSALMRRAAVP